MRTVFADSYLYLALSNPKDEAHEIAYDFAENYHGRIVTTAWVLAEIGDAFSSPQMRQLFVGLISRLQIHKKTTIVWPSRYQFDSGVELFRNRPDKEWSLTDCISFQTMVKRNIREAITGDHHFEQAGFIALLKV